MSDLKTISVPEIARRLRSTCAGTGDSATEDMRLHDEAAKIIEAQAARIADLEAKIPNASEHQNETMACNMTVREQVAAMCLQGLMSNAREIPFQAQYAAEYSIKRADALISELKRSRK